jgi:hypothetical protein
MRRWAAIAGWGALALLALWLVGDRDASRPGDGTVWLAYVATPDGPPVTLAVSGGRAVRLQLWLDLPAPWGPDPRATHPFLVRWRALDAAREELAAGEPFVSARRGWQAPETVDEPLIPVAQGPDRDRVLSDPRTLLLDAPAGTAFVEVTPVHLPDDARLLVVAFEEDPRDAVEQMRAVVGADADLSARKARRMGRWAWDEVPLAWRERLARTVWRRVASSEQAARPVRITSASEWLGFDDAAALGFVVPAGGAAAYNLEDALTFTARWTEEDGQTARPTRTWLEIVGEGLGEVRDLGRVEQVGPLTFEPGVREVRIARDPHDVAGTVLLRATTRADQRDRAWGDPPRAELPPDGGVDAIQRLAPDLTGLIHWRVVPGAPLRFELPADHEIRVVARARLPAGLLPGLGPATPEADRTVTLERSGPTTWTRDLPLPALPSAYERYTQGDDPHTARVSEETEWYLASTTDPSLLVVRADAPVDVQLFVKEPSAPSDVPEPGYPVDRLAEVLRARYLPYARRTWRALFPVDPESLAWEGRAIRIDAQVRWVYRGSAGSSGLEYRVLELPPPFELVAEARAGGPRARLGRKEQVIRVPANGRVLVDYKVPPSDIGKTATLWFEGRKETRELTTAAGTLRFERLPEGPVRARVDQRGVFLANAVGERPWTVRRVWRLDPGRTRTVPIPAGGEGLSVHVARRENERGGFLAWRLRGDGVDALPVSDRRREGRSRLDSRTGSAEVMSRLEETWHWTEPLRLRVGERMEGAAVLELSLEERRDPVWIWISSTWSPGTERLDERHWAIPGVAP